MINWHSELIELARGNEEYARRHISILNTKKQILGVRTPDMRSLAKRLVRELKTFAEIQAFLRNVNDQIYEEVLISGFLIFYSKLSADEKITLTREYLPKADSWAEIDSFVQKFPTKDLPKYWNFALENLQTDQEFLVRYGVIVLFENFLTVDKIDAVFEQLRNAKHDGYYVKMAMAWLYAEAAINFYDQTLTELRNAEIDDWTRRKALQKMLESRRFTDAQKAEIKKLKEQK